MTIAELIAELKQYPQSRPVMVVDDQQECYHIDKADFVQERGCVALFPNYGAITLGRAG